MSKDKRDAYIAKSPEFARPVLKHIRELVHNKRIVTAIEWISQGKSRNWKYER